MQWSVKIADREVARFEVADGASVVLGRGADADVHLDNPAVSRRHCRLSVAGETVRVEDLGSQNGTFVGDARVEGEVALPPGQGFRVAKFAVEPVVAGAAAPARDLDATVVLDSRPARPASRRRLVLVGGRAEPGELDLAGRGVVRVGKGPDCEVRLRGFGLGRVQFSLLASGEGHVLTPKGGWRATRVRGVKASGPTPLAPGDEIAAGPVRFRYE
ncbi:FHA domain-containing protein [Deferrisoma sp.]